ncbi:MAG: DUF86 domain-containing protein [Tannerella sp.]|jgi:uncharacterized protein with HEPN domain|nr:DUF86 domain-containing protein [Tannerella sp.]
MERIRKYLHDIDVSIHSIYDYLGAERDFFAYRNDKKLRRAVEREFEIIGEAVRRILEIDPGIEISEARKIVNMRNWVIHGYDMVDNTVVWGVISNDLPKLKQQIEHLIQTK